jgi:hypothetical protein
MSDAARYQFRIPIGDWSGDGHEKCEHFDASAAKPIGDVRAAWFAAKEKLPDIAPDTFCDEYEEGSLPEPVSTNLRAAGCPLPEDEDDWGPDAMADVVVWFLNQGDPDLDVRLEKRSSVPSLAFYGFDDQKRHIGFIGYGLFS